VALGKLIGQPLGQHLKAAFHPKRKKKVVLAGGTSTLPIQSTQQETMIYLKYAYFARREYCRFLLVRKTGFRKV